MSVDPISSFSRASLRYRFTRVGEEWGRPEEREVKITCEKSLPWFPIFKTGLSIPILSCIF